MYEFYSIEKTRNSGRGKKKLKRTIYAAVFIVVISAVMISVMPPADFPSGEVVVIKEGTPLQKIADDFEKVGLIKSAGLFKTFVIASGGDKTIEAGDYMFERPLSSFDLALRVARGQFGIKKIGVTLPEGLSAKEMSQVLADKLPSFNPEEFIYLTKDMEGYLFPDTYFFFPTAQATDVVRMLRDTFDRKVTPALRAEMEASGRGYENILIMASIIQDEAKDGYEEKQMISGILWKRFDKGMLLQVDATLRYVNGKASNKLTVSDLTDDNPYNTYVHKGLPPTPISSPGIDAIRAAIYPTESPYYFYLHDKKGNIHYAKTFDEHKKNIATYLR